MPPDTDMITAKYRRVTEKLGSQKIPSLLSNPKFIAVYVTAHHWILS
jgi:hypothetical protein